MSNTPVPHDDEIDLFEFFSTVWGGKWLIAGFVILALLIGLGYLQLEPPQYKVNVPFKINVHSIVSQQVCESNTQNNKDWRAADCMNDGTFDVILKYAGDIWVREKKSDVLTLLTPNPKSVQVYQQLLVEVEKKTTAEVLEEANSELTVIQNELSDALLGTERVATNMLNAKRVVAKIESGVSVVSFGIPHIAKSSPKSALILLFSMVIGGVFAVFYIFIGNAIHQRKEPVTES